MQMQCKCSQTSAKLIMSCKVIIDQIIQRKGLLGDGCFFSLKYTTTENLLRWMDMKKPIKRQKYWNKVLEFHLEVKYFPASTLIHLETKIGKVSYNINLLLLHCIQCTQLDNKLQPLMIMVVS